MRVTHISDTHGAFPNLKNNNDIIIHSGDIFPDPPRLFDKQTNALWQENWIIQNLGALKNYFKNTPLYFIGGNHDYVDANKTEELFRSAGINATNIEDKIVSINNLNMYGFPWIKKINNRFNYELNNNAMKLACDDLKEKLESTHVDIIVAHGAMKDGLSNEGYCDYGNEYLNDMFMSMNKDMIPQYMFVGHLHTANGIKFRHDLNMLIVNSATTINSIEI